MDMCHLFIIYWSHEAFNS